MRVCLEGRDWERGNRRGREGFRWFVLGGWEFREESYTMRVCLKMRDLERANRRGRKRSRVPQTVAAGIGRGSPGHGWGDEKWTRIPVRFCAFGGCAEGNHRGDLENPGGISRKSAEKKNLRFVVTLPALPAFGDFGR